MGEAKVIISAQDRAGSIIDSVTKKLGVFNKQGISIGVTMALTNAAINFAGQQLQNLISYLGDAVKRWREYEKTMLGVESITDLTADSMETLKQDLNMLSIAFGVSATEQAKGLKLILRETQNVTEATSVLINANKLAIATNIELTSSIQSIQNILQSYNLTADQSTRVTELLAKMYKRTAIDSQELSEMIARVAPLSMQLGISLEELAGIFTTLSSKGLALRTTIGGYQELLQSLSSPSAEQVAIMVEQGIAYDDLILRSEGLTSILSRLRDVTQGNDIAMRQLVGSTQAYNVALVLTNTKEVANNIAYFTDRFSELNKMYNKNTMSADVYLQRSQMITEYLEKQFSPGLSEATAKFDNFWTKMLMGMTAGTPSPLRWIEEGSKKFDKIVAQANEYADSLIKIKEEADIVAYFKDFANTIRDQTTLTTEMTIRQSQYRTELESLYKQRTLYGIQLGLEDAGYAAKYLDESTKALVDSIRMQREEIQRLQDVNDQYHLSEMKNSLEIMKIQYGVMGMRRGLTRAQQKQIADLEKANMALRIKTQENEIIITGIKQNELTAEERKLEGIKRSLSEEATALDTQISYKEQLLANYETYVANHLQRLKDLSEQYWSQYNVLPGNVKSAVVAGGGLPVAQNAMNNLMGFIQRRGMPAIPGMQTGGHIKESGLAYLHKGETVIPSNKNGVNITVNAVINNDMDVETLVHKLRVAMSRGLINSSGITNARMR